MTETWKDRYEEVFLQLKKYQDEIVPKMRREIEELMGARKFPLSDREYSQRFDSLRQNRIAVSFYKYGSARDNFGGGRVDALKTAYRCLDAFEKDHNTEHLADAANYLMFRFMYPYPGEFFKETDSQGSVGTEGTPINMEKEW